MVLNALSFRLNEWTIETGFSWEATATQPPAAKQMHMRSITFFLLSVASFPLQVVDQPQASMHRKNVDVGSLVYCHPNAKNFVSWLSVH